MRHMLNIEYITICSVFIITRNFAIINKNMFFVTKEKDMAGWDDILQAIGSRPSPIDALRREYIEKLSEKTGRNTIAYYSAFLSKHRLENLDINDSDMEGFMNAVKGMDCNKGLDLILHTPGGDPTAAEAIVGYLKNKFNNDIRVIVPQIAMSAGTMIACSAKEIIMGKQSSLGPIDPQFDGIAAHNIKQEFEEAKRDLAENPQNAQYWAIKLQQYPAAFMKTAIDAISLSDELIRKWLSDEMLKNNPEELEKAVSFLTSHKDSKVHGRHYSYDECMKHGLKITLMEDENDLQDSILSIHHCFIITFAHTDAIKIIGNNMHKDYIVLHNMPNGGM